MSTIYIAAFIFYKSKGLDFCIICFGPCVFFLSALLLTIFFLFIFLYVHSSFFKAQISSLDTKYIDKHGKVLFNNKMFPYRIELDRIFEILRFMPVIFIKQF